MNIILLLLSFLLLAGCQQEKVADVTEKVDKVVVYKSIRELQLLQDGKPIRTYKVALGDNPIGHKQQEGDERTPEGNYVLDWRNPKSAYHKSIHISYPNAADKARAKKRGVSPGGDIMIHGMNQPSAWLGSVQHWRDWTNGCIAVTNDEMDEIWAMVKNGTPIEIYP